MLEDALSFEIAGITVFAYGLTLMLGCWAGLLTLHLLARGNERESRAAAWAGFLALPLGLLFARLAYALLDPNFSPYLSLRNILDLRTGGFSMYGAALGAFLAAMIGARMAKASRLRMLDLFSPAFMAFLVPARAGEAFTALGISRPLTTPMVADSILALKDQYDAYLRTYALEAAAALVLLVVLVRSLRRNPRPGRAFTLACLLYGATQTLMESLRYDGHMRYGFIGVQQVLSAALFCAVLVVLSARLLRRGGDKLLPLLAILLVPVTVAALIGVEFLIDRSGMGKPASYALFLLILALPAAAGIRMIHREDRIG